jgi:hypothetical protein
MVLSLMQLTLRRKTAAHRLSLFHAQPCPKMSPEFIAHKRTIPPDRRPDEDEAFVSLHQALSGLYNLDVNVNIVTGCLAMYDQISRHVPCSNILRAHAKRYIALQ